MRNVGFVSGYYVTAYSKCTIVGVCCKPVPLNLLRQDVRCDREALAVLRFRHLGHTFCNQVNRLTSPSASCCTELKVGGC
jgi:hypothetical protein